MATNTIVKAQKEVFNEAVRGLVDSSVFTGVTSYGPGPSYSFQGSNFGYMSGGQLPGASNVIDKFPFASDANASDVGDLTVARGGPAGQTSSDNGYTSGGNPGTNVIDKFPFSTDANATDVGDLTIARFNVAGQSSSENGYTSGGFSGTAPPNYAFYNNIDKFPFSSDANATDVGDLTQGRYVAAGQSSSENGYTSGGSRYSLAFPYTIYNIIDKFPFASDANATDVGDITARTQTRVLAGQSSTVSGYTSGGYSTSNVIDKFPFASDANATDVGDLTVGRRGPAGQSSTVSGYTSGGIVPPAYQNVIDKFPFATDANATDVGDLTVARERAAGQQY